MAVLCSSNAEVMIEERRWTKLRAQEAEQPVLPCLYGWCHILRDCRGRGVRGRGTLVCNNGFQVCLPPLLPRRPVCGVVEVRRAGHLFWVGDCRFGEVVPIHQPEERGRVANGRNSSNGSSRSSSSCNRCRSGGVCGEAGDGWRSRRLDSLVVGSGTPPGCKVSQRTTRRRRRVLKLSESTGGRDGESLMTGSG